jgi:2-polyprenyl-6-methoxyphenol hydroxylase-like FAD-dependent oxidoreductase|tara:strand:- start:30672 stop:31832 length:1161 start_codon:yes stop_codon:yes gene_type:complete
LSDRKNAKILIVGAGIAGLTAAIILGKSGIAVTVVERDAEMRGGGFLVSLSDAAYQVAQELGILTPLQQMVHRIERSSYHDRTGTRLLALEYDRLFGQVAVIQPMRNDVAQCLSDIATAHADIQLNASIVALSQDGEGVDVTFSDGRQDRFTAVIGADGVHSITRKLAFAPSDIRNHDLGLFCAAYRCDNRLNLNREFRTYMERHRYMATFSTAPDQIGCVFVWAERAQAPPADGPGRASLLKNAFQDSSPQSQAALEHCPQDRAFYMDRLSQIELTNWYQGRVSLVGDAAHCLTLFSGRGAAAAMVGAAHLAKELVIYIHDPMQAFASYQGAQKSKIDAMQKATRDAVKWYVPQRGTIEFARNNAMRWLPRLVFENYFQAKYTTV